MDRLSIRQSGSKRKEPRYNIGMNDLQKADQNKIKQLKQFQKAFNKLMQKYPDVMVYGDRDGEVQAYVSVSFHSLGCRDNTVKLTYEGKVIQ
jgi:hypothetical protein